MRKLFGLSSHGTREGRFGYRWWLYGGRRGGSLAHIEAYLFGTGCSVEVQVGGEEHDLSGDLSIPLLFRFYWSVQVPKFVSRHFPQRKCVASWKTPPYDFYVPDPREMGISIHGGGIWLQFWSKEMEWCSRDPWWVRGFVIHPLDLLLGRMDMEKKLVESRAVVIPMPEGSYEATVELFDCRWKRPRLPWCSKRARKADVKVPRGIPSAGKGESEYDCGDDATFGLWCSASTVEQAIGEIVATAMRNRKNYGSASWLRDAPPVMAPCAPKEN